MKSDGLYDNGVSNSVLEISSENQSDELDAFEAEQQPKDVVEVDDFSVDDWMNHIDNIFY